MAKNTLLTTHLYGDMAPVRANIPNCVRVEMGDLIFKAENPRIDLNAGLRSHSGGTNYCYPMAAGCTNPTNHVLTFFDRFLGVALDRSPFGTTSTISVGTDGVWQFSKDAAAGTTLGKVIKVFPSGYSEFTRSHVTSSFLVHQLGGGVSIGWCVKTESGTSTVDVKLKTHLGAGVANYS